MNKVETVPTLDMPTLGKAFHMITEGFRMLGFTNLEVPGHRTSENFQGCYLVALPDDGDYDFSDYAKLKDHVWLRVSVGQNPDGARIAKCDFKAGPTHWLGVEGVPEGYEPQVEEEEESTEE